jgi:maltose O-acetyltransferase
VQAFRRRLRKQKLRYLTSLAMVAPTMSMRVRLNRWKGVRIGRDPWLGALVYLDIHHSHPSPDDCLVLGDGVAIGNGVAVYTHDSLYNRVSELREPVQFCRVVIGDWVNVSPGAFLYNCTIGSHSIIAPGSVVVNAEFPPYSLIAGNPAKVVRDISRRVQCSLGSDALGADAVAPEAR